MRSCCRRALIGCSELVLQRRVRTYANNDHHNTKNLDGRTTTQPSKAQKTLRCDRIKAVDHRNYAATVVAGVLRARLHDVGARRPASRRRAAGHRKWWPGRRKCGGTVTAARATQCRAESVRSRRLPVQRRIDGAVQLYRGERTRIRIQTFFMLPHARYNMLYMGSRNRFVVVDALLILSIESPIVVAHTTTATAA